MCMRWPCIGARVHISGSRTQIHSDASPVSSRSAAASCSPSASLMAVSAHPGPLSGPVERSIALNWSWNILLAYSEPQNVVRGDSCNLGAPTALAAPPRRILPDPSVRERGRIQQCKIYARYRSTGHIKWRRGLRSLESLIHDAPSVTRIRHRHK